MRLRRRIEVQARAILWRHRRAVDLIEVGIKIGRAEAFVAMRPKRT